ncbi:MAG: ABC transporter permease, partial [Terriglobales bacterium]
LYDRVVKNLEALPGVQRAAIASFLPFQGYATTGYYFPGHPPKPFPDESETGFNAVTPGYFAALEIPLQTGRLFTAADSIAAPKVAVINQTLARQAFPGENAIGRQIHFLWGQEPLRTVIGIVADTQPDMSVRPGPPPPYAYVPLAQAWAADSVVATVRTTRDPNQLIPAARRTLAHLDASLPAIQPESLADLFRDAVAAPRFRGDLVAGFAGLALLLTAVGLYGLLSFTVGGRMLEFGVRAALGARPGQVMRLVLRQALALVGLGALAGLAAAWGLTRLLSDMLFGVSPTDTSVIIVVVVVMLAVGAAAAWGPARRAMRVDAARALREG